MGGTDGLPTVEPSGLAADTLTPLPRQGQHDRVDHGGRPAEQAALDEREQVLLDRERVLAAAEEMAQLGYWIWKIGSDVVEWSEQAHLIFGTDPGGDPATYDAYVSMIHPDDRDRVLAVIRAATQSGGSYEVDHRVVRADGRIAEVRGRGRAELDDTGWPVRLVGGLQDITALKEDSRALQRSRDLFAGVLDAATEQSIIATDPQGLITVFNTGAERMLGYAADEMIGQSPARLHDAGEIRARAQELGIEAGFGVFLVSAAAGKPETRQWTYLTRDGRRLLASITVTAMHGPCGEVTGYIKVGTDITERVQAQAALEDSERRFRDVFDHAPNGMMLFGISTSNLGRFLQVNPALSRLTGYSQEQLLGMGMGDLVPPHDRADYDRRLSAFQLRPVLDGPAERHWIHADGHDLWVQVSLSPGAPGDAAYVVGQVEDITARKQAEARLLHQALHDGLTGLPNRILLMDRIEHALKLGARNDRLVAVLYLDLDGFKAVNDTAGHAVGDQALVHVASRVRAVLRPADTVARLGGDEFVVVCEGLHSSDEVTAIANRVLAAVSVPFVSGDAGFELGCSIGISLSGTASRPEELLHEADQAMYIAKRAGKARFHIGSQEPADLVRSAQAARSVRLTAELQHALDHDELVVFGQPVVDLRSGAVVAVESLLRWHHPLLGLLSPGEFLDVAETGDLIVPIGRLALRESCRMAAAWVAQLGPNAPPVHVNISGRQLESGHLHDDVLQVLADFGLAPSQLVLELTETHMPLIANSVRFDLEDLQRRGVLVALDDLGTGYSSLTRITEMPVDILKIDLSFVARMDDDAASAAVVRGILSIGQELDLQVIAEGVETAAQAERLMSYGCTYVQGYLYSRPLPEAGLASYLQL